MRHRRLNEAQAARDAELRVEVKTKKKNFNGHGISRSVFKTMYSKAVRPYVVKTRLLTKVN